MGKFVGNIDLQVIPGDAQNWLVVDSFQYITNAGETISVLAGLKTDLASTPRSIWWLYPPFGLYTGAAIVHDQLYTEQPYSRSKSDSILLEAMETEGVGWWTRWTIYTGVRVGGWWAWHQHSVENIRKKKEQADSILKKEADKSIR